MSPHTGTPRGLLLLLGLCLMALGARAVLQVVGPGTIERTELLASLEQYRARGLLVSFGDWGAALPEIRPDEVRSVIANYARMLRLAGQSVPALGPDGIKVNAGFLADRLNLYLIRSGPVGDPARIVSRVRATDNAVLVFGNIIIIDVAMMDRLAAIFHRSDAQWVQENPNCADFARINDPDPDLSEEPVDPRVERCVGARGLRRADLILRPWAPLWVVLHEVGHFAHGHAVEIGGLTPDRVIAVELEADGFLSQVADADPTGLGPGSASNALYFPLVSILVDSIERQFGRRLGDMLKSDEIYEIEVLRGAHPPIAFRALSLMALRTDFEIRQVGFTWKISDDGRVAVTNRNELAELLRRIRLVPRNGARDLFGILGDER